ncbi:hypothetical protein DWW23_05305 [Parabacteroides sp. AF14-59]|nr:hypothetical protein DWW23_05305 [Parabacteroides sp. AF14-59]
MKCREVWNHRDEFFTLTEDEERYIRALERLSKMNPGRICLMANGTISVRINDQWHDDNIDACCNVFINCEGGDGGDNH